METIRISHPSGLRQTRCGMSYPWRDCVPQNTRFQTVSNRLFTEFMVQPQGSPTLTHLSLFASSGELNSLIYQEVTPKGLHYATRRRSMGSEEDQWGRDQWGRTRLITSPNNCTTRSATSLRRPIPTTKMPATRCTPTTATIRSIG